MMKTQNKLENKVRFFAEYWEQRIWRYKHTNGEDNLLCINSRTIENKRQLGLTGHLELSLLSAITDEHALEVANIIGWMDLTPEDIISYGWAQFKTK